MPPIARRARPFRRETHPARASPTPLSLAARISYFAGATQNHEASHNTRGFYIAATHPIRFPIRLTMNLTRETQGSSGTAHFPVCHTDKLL